MSKKRKIAKSIVEMIDEIRKTQGAYDAKRLERAADEVPNLERLYQPEALQGLFTGDNAKGIMTMRPGDFERYATPLDYDPKSPKHFMFGEAVDPVKGSTPKGLTQEQYIQYLSGLKGFENVPFLEVNKTKSNELAITGHEGRHRNRALEMSGQPSSLVQFLPRASLREPFPRRSREEYIQALNEEMSRYANMVRPQQEGPDRRPLIKLPDVYKGGGPVHKQDGGAATYNEPMLRRTGKFSQASLDQMRREMEENARRIAAEKQARLDNPPPAEMTEYNPTLQQRLGSATERGLKAVGATTPRARALSDVLTGGRMGSPLPLGMSVMDFTPVAIPVYGGQGVMNAAEAAGKGNYGEAALELGLAGLDLSAAYPATKALVKAAKPMVKAGAKALAPKLGETAEQYMFRTGMALPMDVWHGSPHRFPPTAKNPLGEFDPTKIGTGEGAQAYGHGLYFAESPEVSKAYLHSPMQVQDAIMKNNQFLLDGELMTRSQVNDAMSRNDAANIMDYMMDSLAHPSLKMPKRYLGKKQEELWKAISPRLKLAKPPADTTTGSLYKVDLPDEQIAKMLDWDKPLSEQPKSVQKALKELAERDAKMYGEGGGLDYYMSDPESYSGESMYRYLTEQLSGQPEASSFFKEAGIPGIKYFDAASRNAGEGTRNFVVFPDGEEMLTIKERMKDGGVAHKAGGGVLRRLAKYGKQYEPSKKTEIFIGEKSPMWNAGAAGKAVELEKAGVAPVDIWKQTGTFRSPDGDLRQEISDVGSKFRGEKEMKELASSMKQQEADIKQKIKDSKEHPDLFPKQLKTAQGELRQQAKDIKARRTMESGPEARVGRGNRAEFALEHPELYKAYPLLSGMDVQQGGRSGSALGSYIRGIDERDPGMVNIYDRGLANDPRSTMIHEAQHAIQDIEGWGRGGNPEMAFQNPEAHKILEGLRKEALEPMTYEEYSKKAGLESLPLGDAMKQYEDYKKNIPALAKKLDREIQGQAAQLYYERLAGEAESRAAQARRDLTPEQRLEKFPLEVGDYGYDVKPEDIIVKRNKKGGQVSLDAMRLAVGGMAGGGRSSLIRGGIETVSKGLKSAEKAKQYATPAKFERAPAKTKAEVEALAQRMAPQFLGEFVRKPESTFSVAGKSMKQYKREKDLPIVYGGERPTPDVFDITKHEGEMMVGVPGDPTIAHRTLEQIGDIRPDAPVELHGGPLYGLEGEFWASGKGPATGLQAMARRGSEAYGGVPVVGQYIRMPEGTPYALHTTDALLSFQRPEMLGKRKLEQLNAEIRRGNLKNKFPEFVGFEDPDLVLLQAQDNPNLRKHINNVLLKPTTAEKYGLYPGPDIDAAITEAGLRNLETGATGFSVGRLFPESKLIESAHPTYEFDIPGRMIGQTKYPQPYELTFPDALKFAREGLKPGVGEFGMLKMIGPRQIIDAQLVDEINMYQEAMKRLTGKKKGGTVKKAVGGGVMSAGQKLAKAFVEAGKKAKLPEQAKEAASKGELFLPDEEVRRMQRELLQGVKKPEELAVGGQITSDDLILEERPL